MKLSRFYIYSFILLIPFMKMEAQIINVKLCNEVFNSEKKIHLSFIINGKDKFLLKEKSRNEYCFDWNSLPYSVDSIKTVKIEIKKNFRKISYNLIPFFTFLVKCDNVDICFEKKDGEIIGFMHSCYNWGISGLLKKNEVRWW